MYVIASCTKFVSPDELDNEIENIHNLSTKKAIDKKKMLGIKDDIIDINFETKIVSHPIYTGSVIVTVICRIKYY